MLALCIIMGSTVAESQLSLIFSAGITKELLIKLDSHLTDSQKECIVATWRRIVATNPTFSAFHHILLTAENQLIEPTLAAVMYNV